MNRRAFLAGTAVASAAAAGAAVAGQPQDSTDLFGETGVPLPVPGLPLGPIAERYPDAHIEVLDPRFKGSVGTGGVERVASGMRWAEGPAYFAAGRYLLFSDAPNNRIMRLLEDDNHLSVFRSPSMNANGNTVDREGRLVTCEHSGRRITRTEHDGRITVLADHYEGKRFNSPNDICVSSDGAVWFSDPGYGIAGLYEGLHGESELGGHFVFRIDPKNGRVTKVLGDFDQPNGLCFSPDESLLYVNDSAARNVKAFDVAADGSLGASRLVREGIGTGVPREGNVDGMECDEHGNVWVTGPGGVWVLTPEGDHLGTVATPEVCGSLCWGGPDLHTLFLMTYTTVHSVRTLVGPAPLPPF